MPFQDGGSGDWEEARALWRESARAGEAEAVRQDRRTASVFLTGDSFPPASAPQGIGGVQAVFGTVCRAITLDGGRALRVPVSAVADPVAGEPWPLWVLLFFSYELHEWTRKNGFRAIRGKTAYKFVKFVPFVAKILALTDLSAIYGMLHRTRHR